MKIKDKNKIDKKIMLIPEVKIKIDQLKKTKSVCPKSGCMAKSKATPKVIKKENRYFI